MPRPCHADHALSPDACPLCRLYAHDRSYRALWDAPGSGPPPPDRLSRPCLHRGGVMREERCPGCRGAVRLKVFACSVHGECTVGKPLEALACCGACPDYDPGHAGQRPEA
jgi:hypothetical protein